MSFTKDLVKRNYRTNKNDIVREFFLPALANSVMYKRAVGFFSSTALIDVSKGISGLIRNNGKIRLVVSPRLSPEDVAAITRGYDARKVVEESLTREFYEPKDESETERLNWLAYLIATNRLEIKVAFTEPGNPTGMYHEKIGVMYDADGNRIAFTGSLNDSSNAFYNNYESIVVFNSLLSSDYQRALDVENDFDSLWAGREEKITILEFPKALEQKLLQYHRNSVDLNLDNEFLQAPKDEYVEIKPGTPHIPKGFDFHDYQLEAINKWEQRGYRGIFDMATGTGKTYTGLGAIVRLFEKVKRLAIVVVCPYQHLVDQWVDDLLLFNLKPVIGYSASRQTNWRKRLENDIMDYKLGLIDVVCLITTNATYTSSFVQTQIQKLGGNSLVIIDEAHNFGASYLKKTLSSVFAYRLALSATLERHRDPVGTKALYDYFGEKCIEYDLQRAIREHKLTPYYYHPIVVYLTNSEREHYQMISKKITSLCTRLPSGELLVTEQAKRLLIARARIVAGAENKVDALKLLMEGYVHDTHMLVYCGATRTFDYTSDASERDEDGERQIDAVSKVLGRELGMKVTQFTANETAAERELIKRQFAEANPYQAIVAIKCLDEGVNIPNIRTAFILASSTNPKEYIQRRGRVLRKAEGKEFATIYDFITLPKPLDFVSDDGPSSKLELSLIKKEITRMKEFGEISQNPSEADKLINELVETYALDTIDVIEEEFIDE